MTGGGRGIGRGIAGLSRRRARRCSWFRAPRSRVAETVALVEAAGGVAAYAVTDVEDTESIEAMLATAVERFGPVDMLVNNAGASAPASGPFETLDLAAMRALFENNMWSTITCTRLALPAMLGRGRGRIVNIASAAGVVGIPWVNLYSVAKAALVHFSENLAIRLLLLGLRRRAPHGGRGRAHQRRRALPPSARHVRRHHAGHHARGDPCCSYSRRDLIQPTLVCVVPPLGRKRTNAGRAGASAAPPSLR